MATRQSGPLDVMVGARICMFRVNRGMSQTTLAERIGVTFQQLQNYERGTSRIGAGRLSLIASVLGVSVGELFEYSGAGSSGLNSPMRLLAEPDAFRVLNAYARTTDPRVRLCLNKLVEASPTELSERSPRSSG
ncbi:helix-turn-helix transcriptional regulator [Bradyrhizobium sp. WSM 1738]|uniref:helix-turn-helix domain-containing protein n=1 Tax=Bradyrhizobium hereditatis TaxID=2821405 RepID=UPI001CE319A6|nr:helix-turn-helix transcriptional regulator [Bradyrhizobium hereditatis]MCA6119084.1 helix-turn-helix transcriptional regulator [Bradyrhizobium hereditatis]